MLSVIIPAHNEEELIIRCLRSVQASVPPAGGMEIIVVANGCTDATVERAQSLQQNARFPMTVIEQPEGGKLKALNAGDAVANGRLRAYLDADVTVGPGLLAQLAALLDSNEPRYASGRVHIPEAQSWVTRRFAAFYRTVPFLQTGVPGCGLFAVNTAGRRLWGSYPEIISDDTFVRLQFTPNQRFMAADSYDWPLVEGFTNLVKVRRRQDRGVAEIIRDYPALLKNDDKRPYPLRRLLQTILRHPTGFVIYALVRLAARMGSDSAAWSRGR